MNQVRYFLAVCQCENFTRAASLCNVAQPSLTRAIKRLEEELGGQLFNRRHSKSTLTELGRRIRPHFEMISTSLDAAKGEAQTHLEDGRAKVRLGVMSTISPVRMTGFFARLRQEMPSLELEILEVPGKDLVDQLVQDTFDAALLAWPTPPPSLRLLPLYEERFVIAFAQGHPFGEANAIEVTALENIDYLARVHCEFPEYYEALGYTRPIGANVRYSSEREDWIQAMVASGHGCTIMPEFLPSYEGVSVRPLQDPEITRTVSLATVAGQPHGPALSFLVRCAEKYPWPGALGYG